MKWYASPDGSSGRAVSSAKGLARAKLLWALRIASEFESASPRISGGKPEVNSLKVESSVPRLMGGKEGGFSLFRIMERIACVPQAFWIVWAAKKTFASGS